MKYRYKSRLKGTNTNGWNRTPSQIVSLMSEGIVEYYDGGVWREAVKVSETSFKGK